ncbi:MAG: DUF3365 domain-containing protein [Deltaproteobacteria bacterium]|nr:DUF3365 domain-containing protein [Deltaproteobacteria bacterium]
MRSRAKITVFVSLLIILSLALSQGNNALATKAEEEAALKTARVMTTELLKRTKGMLVKLLHEGDMLKAITVCAIAVPEIMAEFNSKPHHTIKRTSVKYRNPANMPDYYERKILEEMQSLADKGRLTPEFESIDVVTENDDITYLRYMKPLRVEKPCLNCHGPSENIAPEVMKFLAKFYPDDRARDFKEGDLRGAVSVKIALKFPENQP